MAVKTKTRPGTTEVRPFTVENSPGGPRRPEKADRGHPMAGKGNRRRPVAGRATRDDSGRRPLLGERVRLAQGRGAAERRTAVHYHHRRGGHPLHSRPLEARGRAAAHRDARVAGFGDRADENHRTAHRSHGARRERVGCLPPGDPVTARPRFLGQADLAGLEPGEDRDRLDRADEASRLLAVRRAGRRLGCGRRGPDGCAGASGAARHPHQHARGGPTRDRPAVPGRHHGRETTPWVRCHPVCPTTKCVLPRKSTSSGSTWPMPS